MYDEKKTAADQVDVCYVLYLKIVVWLYQYQYYIQWYYAIATQLLYESGSCFANT